MTVGLFGHGMNGQRRRHHLHDSVLQRAVKDAVRRIASKLAQEGRQRSDSTA
jgi:hypothetical protein